MAIESFAADVRYAIRTFRRSPVFAAGALLTLAIGIGANVAVFALVNALLFRPLPYAEPARLVSVEETFPWARVVGVPVSLSNFFDWQARQRSFKAIGVYDETTPVVTGAGEAERLSGALASAGVFRALGVSPIAGRTFADDEDRPGAPPVVVISHALWQKRFAGQPAVGQTIILDDVPRTIVGVMPPGFMFPDVSEVWTPAAVDPAAYPRGRRSFLCVARLKPGVDQATAAAEMRTIAAQLAREYPDDNEGAGIVLKPLRGSLVPAQASAGFVLLMGTVAFVLLIACSNLANLMLSRAAARGHEMAVRSALGASRARLVRQSLTESGLLATAGAALGVLTGAFGRDALVALVPVTLPSWLGFEIDGVVAGFAVLLAVLTTLVVGLVPALRSSRPAMASGLAASGTRLAGGRDRLRTALILSEVALATLLLVGSGLMMRALATVFAVDPGVRAENVWTGRVAITKALYPTAERQRAFFTEAVEGVRALPGVRRVSAVSSLPMSGSYSELSVTIEGRPPASANEELLAVRCVAMPDYFETMGIRLRRGRSFTDHDGLPGTLPVAIVNETFVKQYLPAGDPIGRRVTFGDGTGEDPWLTIVGVVADVRHERLDAAAEPGLFLPYNQQPVMAMTLVARTDSGRLALTESIRRVIARLDRSRAIFAVRTLDQVVARSVWQSRLFTWLFAIFGAVALLLAVIGIYSVISYSVVQRTREMGIRLALGAAPRQIHWLVMRQGLGVALTGMVIGLVGAAIAGRLLRAWLHGISPTDPWTYAAAALVLVVSAWAACLVPSLRATRIEPTTTLRAQ